MTATLIDWFDWRLTRDKEGYRTAKVKWLIETDDPDDGVLIVLATPSLPLVGATYGFGNEADLYMWCTPEAVVTPVNTREPNYLWELEQTFTNKPMKRCNTDQIEDPLDEPQKISGSFVKYTKKARQDKDGDFILSSSHELITDIEQDANRPTVVIEQNVAALGLSTFAAMIDTLNDDTLWGLSARCVKLDNVSWERKLYGTCTYYYTRKFEFSVNYNTFDLADVADAGFKIFDSERVTDNAANRAKPSSYRLYRDGRGDTSPKKVLLDGNGDLLDDPTSPVFLSTVQLYTESDFTTLNIPASL